MIGELPAPAGARRGRRRRPAREGPDQPVPRGDPRDADDRSRTRPRPDTGARSPGVRRSATPRVLFTHLSVPVMTRLRQSERRVLDTLVDAGVARSRSEALAWCVRLVGEHTDEWLGQPARRDVRCGQAARRGPGPDCGIRLARHVLRSEHRFARAGVTYSSARPAVSWRRSAARIGHRAGRRPCRGRRRPPAGRRPSGRSASNGHARRVRFAGDDDRSGRAQPPGEVGQRARAVCPTIATSPARRRSASATGQRPAEEARLLDPATVATMPQRVLGRLPVRGRTGQRRVGRAARRRARSTPTASALSVGSRGRLHQLLGVVGGVEEPAVPVAEARQRDVEQRRPPRAASAARRSPGAARAGPRPGRRSPRRRPRASPTRPSREVRRSRPSTRCASSSRSRAAHAPRRGSPARRAARRPRRAPAMARPFQAVTTLSSRAGCGASIAGREQPRARTRSSCAGSSGSAAQLQRGRPVLERAGVGDREAARPPPGRRRAEHLAQLRRRPDVGQPLDAVGVGVQRRREAALRRAADRAAGSRPSRRRSARPARSRCAATSADRRAAAGRCRRASSRSAARPSRRRRE